MSKANRRARYFSAAGSANEARVAVTWGYVAAARASSAQQLLDRVAVRELYEGLADYECWLARARSWSHCRWLDEGRIGDARQKFVLRAPRAQRKAAGRSDRNPNRKCNA